MKTEAIHIIKLRPIHSPELVDSFSTVKTTPRIALCLRHYLSQLEKSPWGVERVEGITGVSREMEAV